MPKTFNWFFLNDDDTLEPKAGSHIKHCLDEAIRYASETRKTISFKHRKITITVNRDSDADALLAIWEKTPNLESSRIGP